jgi:hypothetical protein
MLVLSMLISFASDDLRAFQFHQASLPDDDIRRISVKGDMQNLIANDSICHTNEDGKENLFFSRRMVEPWRRVAIHNPSLDVNPDRCVRRQRLIRENRSSRPQLPIIWGLWLSRIDRCHVGTQLCDIRVIRRPSSQISFESRYCFGFRVIFGVEDLTVSADSGDAPTAKANIDSRCWAFSNILNRRSNAENNVCGVRKADEIKFDILDRNPGSPGYGCILSADPIRILGGSDRGLGIFRLFLSGPPEFIGRDLQPPSEDRYSKRRNGDQTGFDPTEPFSVWSDEDKKYVISGALGLGGIGVLLAYLSFHDRQRQKREDDDGTNNDKCDGAPR